MPTPARELLLFTRPGLVSSRDNRPLRILADNERLYLEAQDQDRRGGSRWRDVVEHFQFPVFFRAPAWSGAWEPKSQPHPERQGRFLSTLDEADLPLYARGVLHGYSSRNDHAPDDHHQDLYVTHLVPSLDFRPLTSLRLLREEKDQERMHQVQLGALVVLIRAQLAPALAVTERRVIYRSV